METRRLMGSGQGKEDWCALKVGEEETRLMDPTIRIGTKVEVTDSALNTYGMRGEVSSLYPAIRHWQVSIQGPYNNIVLKVLRREQFEPVREALDPD